MIAGLEDVTAGDVSIGGVDVTDMPPQERDIAMVFQNYALYPHMSVKQNLAFGLKLQKLPKAGVAETRRRGRDDARPRGAARPQAVGALRRAAPARRDGTGDRARAEGVPDGRAALEPRCEAACLDARRAGEAPRAARRDDGLRHARPGRGDDPRPACRGAPGRPLQQVDTPQNLFHRPANLFVAAFIGSPSMNLVDAQLATAARQVRGRQPRSPGVVAARRPQQGHVILGMRPT